MTKLEDICRNIEGMEEDEIRQLAALEKQLPLIAALTGTDVFINCFPSDTESVVAAHARPPEGESFYKTDIVGQSAYPDREPAVFHARRLGITVRDLKAITQEEVVVRQDVAPVFSDQGKVIGVLVLEKDISEDLRQKRKFEQLARDAEKESPVRTPAEDSTDLVMMRETNHRIKNTLQMMASIMNLQARRTKSSEAARLLKADSMRLLSAAEVHDIISSSRDVDRIDIRSLLEKLITHISALIPEDREISIRLDCSSYILKGASAGVLAQVVNELLVNAAEHAFGTGDNGEIRVIFTPGRLYHMMTVTDNGHGFDHTGGGYRGLGLRIVEATVREKLRGQLWVNSDPAGSRISFNFEADQQ